MGVYSTTTRYTGLSGIDTESMVTAMMNAESVKYNNLKKTRQKTEWKQEAYKTQLSAISAFQKSFLDILGTNSLRKSSTFLATTATVSLAGSTSKAATVKTTSSTATGSHTLSILQLAQSDTYTSSSKIQGSVESSSAFDVKNLEVGDSINVTVNGKTSLIKFEEADLYNDDGTRLTNEEFVDKLNAKLKSTFGTQTGYNEDGSVMKDDDGNVVTVAKAYASLDASGKLSFNVNGNNELKVSEGSGRNTTKTVSENFTAPTTAGDYVFSVNGESVTVTLTEEQAALDDEERTSAFVASLKSAMSSKNVKVSLTDGNLTFAAVGTTADTVITFDSAASAADLGISDTTLDPTSVLTAQMGITNGATTTFSTSKTLGEAFSGLTFDQTDDSGKAYTTLTINGKTIKAYEDEDVKTFMTRVNNSGAGVKLSFDTVSQSFKLEGTSTGATNSITFGDDSTAAFLSGALGINTSDGPSIKAQDAEFIYDGERYFRESNSVSVGDVSLTLNETTVDETTGTVGTLKIEVSKNTDDMLSTIKSFVEAYNALIEGINGAVNEKRAKSGSYSYYEPLTDDEKSEMTETQISQWEAKAKQGILYRDQTLSGITSSMRTALYSSVSLGDGRKISLYEIGITTSSNVSDQGKLVIDEDKLLAALEERGEDIGQLFAKSGEGLAEKLNTIVNNAIGSTGSLTRKVGSDFYASTLTNNDLYNLLKKQDEQLADMLVALRTKEENYYTKFSKMETAVTTASSQLSYLQAMMGS